MTTDPVIDTIKQSLAGLGATTTLSVISLQDITEVLQLISVLAAIIVAVLTMYLTTLKIKNEKDARK